VKPEVRLKMLDVLITVNFIAMASITVAVLVIDEFKILFNWHLLAAILPFLVIGILLNRARLNTFEETL